MFWPHHFLANIEGKVEAATYFLFLGTKISADGDYSHEIRRQLLLGRNIMTNINSILKSKYFSDKFLYTEGYGLFSGHIWFQYFSPLMQTADFLAKTLMWERLRGEPVSGFVHRIQVPSIELTDNETLTQHPEVLIFQGILAFCLLIPRT